MKRFVSAVILAISLFWISTSNTYASEGKFTLDGMVTCEGISIWHNSRYQISGRCHGLIYPYAETYDEYVLWAVPSDGSNHVKIDTVDKGIFSGSTNRKINNLYITAETGTSPKTPSAIEITRGEIDSFSFKEPTITEATPAPVTRTEEPKTNAGINITGGRRIPTFAIVLFVVIIIVLGVILSRKR